MLAKIFSLKMTSVQFVVRLRPVGGRFSCEAGPTAVSTISQTAGIEILTLRCVPAYRPRILAAYHDQPASRIVSRIRVEIPFRSRCPSCSRASLEWTVRLRCRSASVGNEIVGEKGHAGLVEHLALRLIAKSIDERRRPILSTNTDTPRYPKIAPSGVRTAPTISVVMRLSGSRG